jgi:hypothetical protein
LEPVKATTQESGICLPGRAESSRFGADLSLGERSQVHTGVLSKEGSSFLYKLIHASIT